MQQFLGNGAEAAARGVPGRALDVHVEVGGMSDPPGRMGDEMRRNTMTCFLFPGPF
ncbi:MAG: hypothetical protein KGQ52_08210 [Alphaproteobacteria bacterium]|nr:hypothetical protein [Alphaproteobacteria bacterium]